MIATSKWAYLTALDGSQRIHQFQRNTSVADNQHSPSVHHLFAQVGDALIREGAQESGLNMD